MEEINKNRRTFVCLIFLSAILIMAGIVTKQPDSVLAKAATICLECIGIG